MVLHEHSIGLEVSKPHSLINAHVILTHRSRPLIDISRDNLDEQVFEEEFSPVRRRSRKATEVAKMFVPPEPVLSNIK